MSGETIATVLTAFGAFAGAFGIKELLGRWATRRGVRQDTEVADRKAVAAVDAQGNLEVLKVLLTETKNRVDGYEAAIAELKASHAADIRELKTENRSLDRQVSDLRISLQEYQLGNRVPRGMVLVSAREIRRLREMQPGLLEQRWYPGELEADGTGPGGSGGEVPGGGPSIVARVTRLDGPHSGGA